MRKAFNIKELVKSNSAYTNDIVDLNYHEDHYVFVYGTFKTGGKRSDFLSGVGNGIFKPKARKVGVGVTVDEYDMMTFVSNKDRFPVLLQDTGSKATAKVRGEVWLVPTNKLVDMDHIERNGYLYSRQIKQVYVGKRKLHCYMYIGVNSTWRNSMDNLENVPIANGIFDWR